MSALKQSRIQIFENPHYKKSGIKSYVWLLQKYGFKPTQPGPYFREASAHHAVHPQRKFVGAQHELHNRHHHSHHHHHKCDENSSSEESSSKPAPVGGGAKILSTVLQKYIDAEQKTVGQVTSEDQQNDSLYLTTVQIGTPPQPMKLDFDTGSSDLWVWSTKLDAATQQQGKSSGKNIFDPSKSSTWKASSGSTWEISYGDGSSASGTVGTDNVTIGSITIKNQAIECASKLAPQFVQGDQGEGLLGLAWGSINTVKPKPVQTPVENMITQDDIPANAELFTAYLGSWRDANEDDKGISFYTFGEIDQDVLKRSNVTEPYYTPLVDEEPQFWRFASASYSINGKTTERPNNTAIADTGTTLALVDDATCKAIYAAIPGAKYDDQNQGYIFPTDTKEADYPEVAFAVGDKLFTVGKEDFLFAETTPGWCYGGIQSRGDMTFDILGDTFLKSIYAIFDQGNKQFGAVQRIEKETNLAPPQSSS